MYSAPVPKTKRYPVMTAPRPIRVLCVDDNRDLADTTAAVVQLFGYEVTVCYDGPTAIRLAGAAGPDICLIDLNMPAMPGDELAVRIRQLHPDRKVILVAVTAMSSEEARERTRRAGFDLHLVKPVDPSKLLGVISELARHG